MPQIPDVQVGPRTVVKPTQTVTRMDTSAAGFAEQARAKAAAGIAGDMQKLSEINANEQFNDATVKMSAHYEKTRQEFEADDDYSTIPDRSTEAILKRRAEVSEGITNPRARALFEQDQAQREIKFNAQIGSMVFSKEKDHRRSVLSDNLNLLTGLVDKGDISDTVFIAQDMMNDAIAKGYYTHEEGDQVIKKWQDDTALTGIARIEDPNKQIEALNSDWAVAHIDPAKRQKALKQAEDDMRERELDDYALDAAGSPTRSDALTKALNHPTNKVEAVKKTMELRDQMEGVQNAEIIKTIADEIAIDGVFNRTDPRLKDLDAKDVAWLEALNEKEKAGVKTTDPDVYAHANNLAARGQWKELQSLISGPNGSGNPFMTVSHRQSFQAMVSKGRAGSSIKDDDLIKEIFGKQVTGKGVASKNRMIRAQNMLADFRSDYLEANGSEPSQEELQKAVMDMKREYDVDWSFFDAPVVDAPYEESRQRLRDAQVESIKELNPREYQALETVYGEELNTMSQFEIASEVKKVEHMEKIKITEPDIYNDTLEIIRVKEGDEFRDFDKVYRQLKSIRRGN